MLKFIRQSFRSALLRQLGVFGVVGAIATLAHYLVALFSHELGGINIYIANLAGYGCAVAVSFFGHARFTFGRAPGWQPFIRFGILSVSVFCLSELVLLAMERGFELHHRMSLAVVVVTIPAITFIFSRYWVFRRS